MDDLAITAVGGIGPVNPAQDVRAAAAAASPRDPQAQTPVSPPTEAQMVASANAFENALAQRNLHLRFSAKGMQIVTELVDQTSGKVIRRIPTGRLSDMLASGTSDFSGLFVDAVG